MMQTAECEHRHKRLRAGDSRLLGIHTETCSQRAGKHCPLLSDERGGDQIRSSGDLYRRIEMTVVGLKKAAETERKQAFLNGT